MTNGPEPDNAEPNAAPVRPPEPEPGPGQGVLFASAVEYSEYPPSPIPSPGDLARYNELDSGLARELVEMAKKEQDHRHRRELFPYRLSKRGQTLGLIALILLLVFCGWLVHTGNPVAGTILAGLDVLGIVAVFVTGSLVRRSKNDADNR